MNWFSSISDSCDDELDDIEPPLSIKARLRSNRRRYVYVSKSKSEFKQVGKFSKKRVLAEAVGKPTIFVVAHWTATNHDTGPNNGNGPWWCAKTDELRKMVVAGQELVNSAFKNPNENGAAEWWFGSGVDHKVLAAKLDSFKIFLSKLSLLCFECAEGTEYATSYAACAQNQFNATSTDLRIYLGGGFKNDKYSLGVIINAYLHELSHICLRTDDVPKGEKNDSKKYYTAKKARELAKTNPKLAITNAENWGYYLCEFRKNVTNYDIIDWKNSYERIS